MKCQLKQTKQLKQPKRGAAPVFVSLDSLRLSRWRRCDGCLEHSA
jgi:hypothetical protein